MRYAALLCAVLICAASVDAGRARAAEERLSAAAVTERGRKLDRILDMILAPRPGAAVAERSITFLLDPTPALHAAGFPVELAAALDRNARGLAGVRIGIGRVGGEGKLHLAPTLDREAVDRAAARICGAPSRAFVNVYAEVRRVLPELRREAGSRDLVLVTLENGDVEDDLEETVRQLARSRVRLSVIAREAFLSDPIHVLNPPEGPRDTTYTGSDSAFVELPWSFRFQYRPGNVAVLSGFAMYGLTRLAAATEGLVFLYYPGGAGHDCAQGYGMVCPFCAGDHDPTDEAYQSQRLRAITPLAESRQEVIRIALADPYYRAVQDAWDRAMRTGLVYVRPSVDRQGGGGRIDPNPYRGWTPLGTSASFSSEAGRARRLRRDCLGILDDLERGIERGRRSGGLERYRAVAETTRLLLLLTDLNLQMFVTWCEEVGPEQATRRQSDYEAPEYGPYPTGSTFIGIGYNDWSLCHGVEPFHRLRLPGGESANEALRAFQKDYEDFTTRWAHTPFALVARRSGIARFWLVRRPGYVPPGRRRVPSSSGSGVTTLPDRPSRTPRPGSGTSGGGDAPTTGGGE